MGLFNNLKARGSLLIGYLIIAVVILTVLHTPSNAQPDCRFEQLTNTVDGEGALVLAMNIDGTKIAFASNAIPSLR